MKRKAKQMLPVIGIIMLTIMISLMLYWEMIRREEDRCWQLLNDAAQSVEREITTKFKDEMAKLRITARMMACEEQMDVERLRLLHLDAMQETSVFTRIDVLYPDNRILCENGTKEISQTGVSFHELAARGEHISVRSTDIEMGKQCVYYCQPVVKDGEPLVILIGVIETNELARIFNPTIYDGEVNSCIIDRRDGSFIMDNWHEELGNVFEMEDRKRLKGYEDVDMKEAIRQGETGVIAFESHTTGKPLYMYYMPINIADWHLEIFVQEDVVFRNLFYLKHLFWAAGIVEAFMLLVYFSWNLMMMSRLEKSKTEIEKQQEQLHYLSYRDMLTLLFNRNKYIEVIQTLSKKALPGMGVLYIDLNGLKEINDTQSHEAGDSFIKNTAKVISEVFYQKGYRIGGDEFVVLDMDVEEEAFMDKVKRLGVRMDEEQLSVSVGFCWQGLCENLDAMLKEAEMQMYEEKECYYQEHCRYR